MADVNQYGDDEFATSEEFKRLVAQLHYDRADIARVSAAAAAAMDIVIQIVRDAMLQHRLPLSAKLIPDEPG